MALYGVISNLLSFGAQLVPAFSASAQAPSTSSSSSSPVESQQIETELKQLMRMLERIKATLYDAEMREIRDLSVKLWLKELNGVAYEAEDVLDEYRYEVLRARVEARDATSHPNSRKRKLIQVPNGMLDQIRQIMSKFSEIEKHRIALKLTEDDGPRHCNSDMQVPPTSHFVVESDIIGRDREKKNLIDEVSSANDDGKIISVVAIVGTGGIGKTTLAKLVYNDQRIKQKFNKFGWVCVSEDFNVQRLTREVLESITGKSFDHTNLSALQEHMKKEISDKMVFLVLDDVWNENRSLWESFKASFMSATLMKILVTTRNEPVARIMQTVSTFNVSYMSEEQSWQLFQHYAFGEATQNRGPTFVEIGEQIMKKCGMLPLAIKSIASLLRHEPKEESWREILESELWESAASNEIFQPLQISYARLPTYLKPCFLYCSMFPKDYEYSVEELVKLWISQGYVQTNGLKNARKIGLEYAKQLWQRSFFQGYTEDKCMENLIFTLHDMFHDLARFYSGRAYYSIGEDMVPNFPNELRHLYVKGQVMIEETPLPGKFATLRTFIVRDNWHPYLSGFDFSEAKILRALLLNLQYNNLESHFSFANLKHLRYLSIDMACNRLPECICSLYNLQYFTLSDCSLLPECIGNLVSLEELEIIGCDLQVVPDSLCQLRALRKLHLWGINFEELPPNMGNLVSLEELIIFDCDNMRVLPLSFCQLKILHELKIIKCSKLEELPPDMGNLISLEKLKISFCYNLRVLPVSLCQLKVLQELEIIECSRLEELPPDMGNLVSLEKLIISNCHDLRMLPVSLCQLKVLLQLEIIECSRLEEFPPDMGNLVSLEKLLICDCYNLTVLPVSLCQLKVLQGFKITKCSELEELPPGMENLTYLQLLDCDISSLPLRRTVRLDCTRIGWLKDFVDLEGTLVLSRLCRVGSLEDVHCANLASMHNLQILVLSWNIEEYPYYLAEKLLFLSIDSDGAASYDNDGVASSEIDHCSLMGTLQPHPNLKELEINDYCGLTFPEWFGNPTLCASLEKIMLYCCKSITFLPFGSFEKLKHLHISGCSSLQFIQEQSLPLALERIEIFRCQSLISVTGIERLKSLVKLYVYHCRNLYWLDPSVNTGIITVVHCPKVKESCLQRDINYEVHVPLYMWEIEQINIMNL
ncbi:hypothetical protein LUZ63_016774 [Rhynchospora breviuscula]|uniref:Uncharacterized protein n=1 Tax=Rhynchospora breviuscula TaxID=2022672 RepID=A0A9Q0C174_9POAL|nr:hypothetical protein LUZ63_016774 [Rhynchospora breviuscula]